MKTRSNRSVSALFIPAFGTACLAMSFAVCETARADIPPSERSALIDLYHAAVGADWTDNTGWEGAPGTECFWYGIECTGDHVTSINLYHNNLTEVINPTLCNLPQLLFLYLDRNDLTGSIPVELAGLNNLQYLFLGENRLSGTIPGELGSMDSLEILHLPRNQLTGAIPHEMGSLSNLTTLVLAENQLTGTIPTEVGNLGELQSLQLPVNLLTGMVPGELGRATNLLRLGLSSNRLEGPVPVELTDLVNLLDGQSDFRWNALYTDNPTLSAFLTQKQRDGGDWAGTQTVAPEDLSMTTGGDTWIQLGWSAIPYTEDAGGYEIYYAETAGGPYALFETTADKTVTSSRVTGLNPESDYYFLLRTVTLAHEHNQSDLYSQYSDELPGSTTAMTPSPTPVPTGTPTPGTIGVALVMDDTELQAGDPFHLGVTTWNETGTEETVNLFIILDVSQYYWFWPNWTPELSFEPRTLPDGYRLTDEPVLDFTWPDGAGGLTDCRFWGAFTDEAIVDLVGGYDMVTWGAN